MSASNGMNGSGLEASMSWTNANSFSVYSSLRSLPRSVIRSNSLLRLSFITLCRPANGDISGLLYHQAFRFRNPSRIQQDQPAYLTEDSYVVLVTPLIFPCEAQYVIAGIRTLVSYPANTLSLFAI